MTSPLAHGTARTEEPQVINPVINGCFDIAQRAYAEGANSPPTFNGTGVSNSNVPTNDDGAYLFDRWVHLSNGNDIVDLTRETSTTPDSGSALRLNVVTSGAKFGGLQILPNEWARTLAGSTVSLSFEMRRSSTNVSGVRVAILEWTGTADDTGAAFMDPVSSWGSDGGALTLKTNWAFASAEEDLGVQPSTTEFTKYEIEGVQIDGSATNVAIMFWVNDQPGSTGVDLYVSKFQLDLGPRSLPYRRFSYGEEFDRCRRYFYIIAVTETGASSSDGWLFAPAATSLTLDQTVYFPTRLRAVPSVDFGTIGLWRIFEADGTGGAQASGSGVLRDSPEHAFIELSATGTWSANQAIYAGPQSAGNMPSIFFDAEVGIA